MAPIFSYTDHFLVGVHQRHSPILRPHLLLPVVSFLCSTQHHLLIAALPHQRVHGHLTAPFRGHGITILPLDHSFVPLPLASSSEHLLHILHPRATDFIRLAEPTSQLLLYTAPDYFWVDPVFGIDLGLEFEDLQGFVSALSFRIKFHRL